jgi:CRISPR system Cascade subunit CasE
MKGISDVYQLHQFVMAGFKKHKQTERVLFRVEPEQRGRAVRVLVQSLVEPDWDYIKAENHGIVDSQVKKINLQLQEGRNFRFRLRANPVITRAGKRYGLIRDEKLIEWLRKKENLIGASFPSVLPIDEGYITGSRGKGDQINRIQIKSARYEGILKVIDRKRFYGALTSGIGPAKAFGCGLLSIAPAKI